MSRDALLQAEQYYPNPRVVYGRVTVLTNGDYSGKRAIDLILSAVLIVLVLTWLTPVLYVLIRLGSEGGAFFRQTRMGRNGKLFVCLKFRTMYLNEKSDILQASADDQRITPLGRWLRRFHIDELPQLINVLRGDMSLVGPRPYMLADHELFGSLLPDYDLRHSVKPGLTGLAQVKGFHGPTPDFRSIRCRTRLDHFYVQKSGLFLDLKIIAATIISTFTK